MRQFKSLFVLLAFLLALTACGSAKGPDVQNPDPPPKAAGEEMTVYDCGGYQIALPSQYLDQLLVQTEDSSPENGWTQLLEVCEKTSYEDSMKDYGFAGGFLFGFGIMDQAAFEQHICADISGTDVFATDGERYFAFTYPTDVQFYRSGGEIDTQSGEWASWEQLNNMGDTVRDDFLERNGLQSFTVQDYVDRLAAADGNHVCVRYYPYFLKDGDTRIYDQLLLRQPARQGEGGIWAVEQWMDVYGNRNLYFPDSGKPSAEYYAELQAECDAGEHPEYLTPTGAAAVFVQDYFANESADGSFEQGQDVNAVYMDGNQRLEQLALDVMAERAIDDWEVLACVGEATADNWGVLGRNMYGSEWFEPLMEAVSSAAVGEEQQFRVEAIAQFYLATEDMATDFHTPLRGLLQVQRQMDPEAYQAAMTAFTKEEQSILLGAALTVQSSSSGSDIPEKVEPAAE